MLLSEQRTTPANTHTVNEIAGASDNDILNMYIDPATIQYAPVYAPRNTSGTYFEDGTTFSEAAVFQVQRQDLWTWAVANTR